MFKRPQPRRPAFDETTITETVTVQRIKRTRPPAKPDTSWLDDDEPLPAWRGDDGSSSLSRDIASIAAQLRRLYERNYKDGMWPDAYRSLRKRMSEDQKKQWGAVLRAVNDAVTIYLASTLELLELRVLLMIINRTLKWSKPWEGIPHDHFENGVFGKRRQCLHAPISGNRSHLNKAIERLHERKLIEIGEALTESGYVRTFAIDVVGVLRAADIEKRKLESSPNRRRRGTARSSTSARSEPKRGTRW